MTPTIPQNVIPRRPVKLRHGASPAKQGHRQNFQRGSISSATTALTLGIIVIVSITILTFFYLSQVQSTAAQGTDIHVLEEQLQQLRERQRTLELEGARLRSIQAIEDRAQKLNLINTDQFAYLPQEPANIFTLAP